MPSMSSLHDLFVRELKDIFNAEKQLVKGLPKMTRAASCESLRAGFEEHTEQAEGHIRSLERIFESFEVSGRGGKCRAMDGIIKQGTDAIDEEAEPVIKDTALIAAAQKVEYYEMASYGTLVSWARQLGHSDAEQLLQQMLEEVRAADRKLTELAASELNVTAGR